MERPISEAYFQEAKRHIPGGVSSPVRAFKAVGGTPPFLVRGEGPTSGTRTETATWTT